MNQESEGAVQPLFWTDEGRRSLAVSPLNVLFVPRAKAAATAASGGGEEEEQ